MGTKTVTWAVKKYDDTFGWRLVMGYTDDHDHVMGIAKARCAMGQQVKIVRKTEILEDEEVSWDGKNEARDGAGSDQGVYGQDTGFDRGNL